MECSRLARNIIIDVEAMLSVYFNCEFVDVDVDAGKLVVRCPCEDGEVEVRVEVRKRG